MKPKGDSVTTFKTHLFNDHLGEALVRSHERVLAVYLQLVKEVPDLHPEVFRVRDVGLLLLLEVLQHPLDALHVGGGQQEGIVVFAHDAALERRVGLRLKLEVNSREVGVRVAEVVSSHLKVQSSNPIEFEVLKLLSYSSLVSSHFYNCIQLQS